MGTKKPSLTAPALQRRVKDLEHQLDLTCRDLAELHELLNDSEERADYLRSRIRGGDSSVTVSRLEVPCQDPDRFVIKAMESVAESRSITRPTHVRDGQIWHERRAWMALMAYDGVVTEDRSKQILTNDEIAKVDREISRFMESSSSDMFGWQYLGVVEGHHEFRHRFHPTTRRREYRRIPAR
jgi:hypothetical protein